MGNTKQIETISIEDLSLEDQIYELDTNEVYEAVKLAMDRALGVKSNPRKLNYARFRAVAERRLGIGCEPMTLKDIAKEFGISQERTRQIEQKTYALIRRTKEGRELKAYLGQRLDS